ncbi:LysE family translocator [Paucilactobacillus nenjiangensis]|uniref:LysE family translocator n=1 Tax=Paucilactobacillus nenjiangensis TaxID=1296540 RepID=UPI0028D6696F|nr:LysE family transporter [Paucilactobacillus nenjiangensis]
MTGFLAFITVMSFTPGPNTIMAMSEGQQKGFRKGLVFNLGILFGLIIIGGVISLFASIFQQYESVVFGLKIIGSLYLLYLAYHVLISHPDSAAAAGQHPFMTGALLQATNIKCYLYFVTGMSTFAVAGLWGTVPMKFTIMILFGIVGTLTWTLAGQLIQNFYSARYRGINLIVSALLVFSAYDLWR